MNEAHAYDELPYPGYVYWFTHPDHLGVLGHVHGVDTAPAERCRVLELGCGDGGNLIPLAAALPDSQFLGVDLSAAHIRAGSALIAALGLTNIELRHGDVAALDVAPATWDYVVAHGLYSWIPDAARDAVLALTARALAPQGVALISYNTYPGWHDHGPVRRLMRFHTRPVASGADKVAQARAIAHWHCERMARLNDAESAHHEAVWTTVEAASDSLIRHDYLAEHHRCFYFEDFMADARGHGLDFLTNARPAKQRIGNFEPEVARMLEGVTDIVRRQQYMDFFSNNRFRVTLLCHADVAVDRDAPRARFDDLCAEARIDTDVWAPETRDLEALTLETRGGAFAVSGAPLRIVLSTLQKAAPRAVPFDELLALSLPALIAHDADGGLGATPEGRATLLTMLVTELTALYFVEVVQLWRTPPPVASSSTSQPFAPPLQRLHAASGAAVPTLTHRQLPLTEQARRVLADLDGTRDLTALRDAHGADADAIVDALRRGGFLSGLPVS